nr:hypothetical protein [Tanacetum cinerariifolium]
MEKSRLKPDKVKAQSKSRKHQRRLRDKIICDLDQTPNLSQRSPQNCPKCGHPVNGHYCQGCALLRKKFKEDLFTSCIEHEILQDCFEPSNDNTNVFFCHQCTCKLCGNGAHYGYNCPPKVLIIHDPEPFNNQTIKELPPTVQSFDPKADLVHDSPNVFDPPLQLPFISCEFCRNDACYGHYCTPQSSVENLVPIPREFEGEFECNMPSREEFKTFSNILFDSDYDFYSSDDQSFSDEDFSKEIYLNPLFDEEIIPMKIDPHPFNVESDLIESMLNQDSSIIISSKIDSLFDEFRLLYDNSSPRPPEEFVSKNSNAEIKSFSPSLIPVEDSDSLMEEIDFSFILDYPMPSGIEDDDYDSERDILILDELLSNDSLSLPKKESFHFDIPSFSCPSAKPPDGEIS